MEQFVIDFFALVAALLAVWISIMALQTAKDANKIASRPFLSFENLTSPTNNKTLEFL